VFNPKELLIIEKSYLVHWTFPFLAIGLICSILCKEILSLSSL
jgi:hypothetical protein